MRIAARRAARAGRKPPAEPPGRAGATVLSVRDRTRGDLDVLEGETAVLLGPSGSGKSTWLRSLLGLGEAFERTEVLGEQADRTVLGRVRCGTGVAPLRLVRCRDVLQHGTGEENPVGLGDPAYAPPPAVRLPTSRVARWLPVARRRALQ